MISRRGSLFDSKIDGHSLRFSDREGVGFKLSGGVVDGPRTGVVPTGHLLNICMTSSLLFLKEFVSEYSGAEVKFILLIILKMQLAYEFL